jgi:rhodanese-related sulfurtransferase
MLGMKFRHHCLALVLGMGHLHATPVPAAESLAQSLSIAPEALKQMRRDGALLALVEADVAASVSSASARPADQNIVFYSSKLNQQAALDAAAALRDKGRSNVYWLEGTPALWAAAGLRLPGEAENSGPVLVSARDLKAALANRASLQIVDLAAGEDVAARLPGAKNLMPHQLDAALAKFQKTDWIVLVDNGNRMAQPLADKLYAQGFALVGVVDGGYPAWLAATSK